MAAEKSSAYPPKGLLRIGFRAPVYVYRAGLGWLFGKRFVLINHIGRKSGRPHQAVVEVVERDSQTGDVLVVAGYGEQTQWYQNLKARPETTIQIGSRKIPVMAEFITPDDGQAIMVRYADRYGALTGRLFSMMGYQWDGTIDDVRRIARESLRFVRFRERLTAARE